jgi:hypothetical protein
VPPQTGFLPETRFIENLFSRLQVDNRVKALKCTKIGPQTVAGGDDTCYSFLTAFVHHNTAILPA